MAALRAMVSAQLLAVWDTLGPAGVQASPAAATAAVIGGQASAARMAAQFLAEEAMEQIGELPGKVIAPRAFAGATAAGRSLDDALGAPTARMFAEIDAGRDPVEAQMAARGRFALLGGDEAVQAGSNALGAGIVAEPAFTRYLRVLNPPSCSRCAILAGRLYFVEEAFDRHPRCFPAGVTVSGPAAAGATRRWYEGELVTIRTASGKELPATANHPVLTDRGWLPAHLLQVGDNVIGSTLAEGAVPLVVPHEQQMPTRIEDAFRAFGVGGLLQVPTAAEDFHGDGGHGDVDVVTLDGFLRDWRQSTPSELVDQVLLAGGLRAAAAFAGGGDLAAFGFGVHPPAGGFVGGGGLRRALLSGHVRGSGPPRFGVAAGGDPGFRKALADRVAGHVEPSGDGVLALPAFVGRDDLGHGQGEGPPRWDAPAGPFTVESRRGYADRGQDLALRLSGQVELDRVVEVSRVGWSGHVWNLTSTEGWYAANGIIVSNCDCLHVPAADAADWDAELVSPEAYFDSLTVEEQDRIFGKANAQAIRDGADIIKVVNVNQRGPGLIQFGVDSQGKRVFRRRMTVEQVYTAAGGDRRRIVQLLEANGYVRDAGNWDYYGRLLGPGVDVGDVAGAADDALDAVPALQRRIDDVYEDVVRRVTHTGPELDVGVDDIKSAMRIGAQQVGPSAARPDMIPAAGAGEVLDAVLDVGRAADDELQRRIDDILPAVRAEVDELFEGFDADAAELKRLQDVAWEYGEQYSRLLENSSDVAEAAILREHGIAFRTFDAAEEAGVTIPTDWRVERAQRISDLVKSAAIDDGMRDTQKQIDKVKARMKGWPLEGRSMSVGREDFALAEARRRAALSLLDDALEGGTGGPRPAWAKPKKVPFLTGAEYGPRSQMRQAMDLAADSYPRTWLDRVRGVLGHRPVPIHRGKRGLNRSAGGGRLIDITLSDYLQPRSPGLLTDAKTAGRNATAIHELGHTMEAVVPGLTDLEWAFLARRAGATVDGIPDMKVYMKGGTWPEMVFGGAGFAWDYSGKAYARTGTHGLNPNNHYEVFTTGIESLLGGQSGFGDPVDHRGRHLAGEDAEFRAFILGVLLVLGRRA